MAELSIGGEAFHVVIEGEEDAPVLMLSNAMGTNLHLWESQMPALLTHYRVLRYDARGHGNSVVSEGPYSIAQLGQDALAILDTLGLEKVDFLGLSLGGMVGQWLLTHAPKRIGKAVLADTAPQIAPPDLWNNRIETVLQDGMGALVSGLLENWFTRDFRESHADQVAKIEEMILRTPPEGYAASCAAIRDMDLREALRSVHAPVLVMVGRHDTTTPQGIAALMTSSIPKAKLVTLEAAHLSNIEDAEQFTEKALEFLLAEEPVAEPESAPEPEAGAEAPAPKAKPPRKPRVKKAPVEAPALEVIVTPEPVLADEPAAEKPVPKKATPKKAAPKKAAPKKKPAAKAAPKKAPAKKAAAKKSPVKKAAAKKAAPKKSAVKKAAPKKAVKKSAIKKTPVKKTAVKKSVAKKSPVKKAAAKKTAVKKSPVKKGAIKKAAVKKSARKTVPPRKAAPAKAARKPVKKTAAKKTKRR